VELIETEPAAALDSTDGSGSEAEYPGLQPVVAIKKEPEEPSVTTPKTKIQKRKAVLNSEDEDGVQESTKRKPAEEGKSRSPHKISTKSKSPI
jgi:hypothetical protein